MPKTYEDGLREAMEIAEDVRSKMDAQAPKNKQPEAIASMASGAALVGIVIGNLYNTHLATMQEKNDAGQ